ncbi:MAG TPA: hypothetical protein VJC11_03235 [Patescibacteria group bacterium]|nr:hypothetical protein [Patescibacteria group bacterium]
MKSNYRGDGEVFLAVSCGRSVTHAVGNLRPNTEYRIRFAGELIPQRQRSSADGVVVFYNPYGKDATMTLKEEVQ